MVALDRRNLLASLRAASFKISDRSVFHEEDVDDEDSLEENSAPSGATAPAPALRRRSYSIGTNGANDHLKYDLFGQHQLDLHNALVNEHADEPKIDSAAKWLQQIEKERQAKSGSTSPPKLAATPSNLAAHKRWALLRTASRLLKAFHESQAHLEGLGAEERRNSAPWPLPDFDVLSEVEQVYMAKALAGDFDEFFYGAYLPSADEQAFFQQQQQQFQMQDQFQQFLLFRQQQAAQEQLQMQYAAMQEQLQMQYAAMQEQHWQMQQQLQLQQQMQQPMPQAPPSPLPYQQHQQPSIYPTSFVPPTAPMAPMAPAPPAPAPLGAAGGLVEMARSKDGSMALQRDLRSMPPARLAAAVAELAPHLLELALDTFGNYLVSGMMPLPAAQPAIAAALRGHVLELAAHAQGSRIFQAALQALDTPTVASLVDELEGSVAEIAARTNGSWSVCAAFNATHAPFIAAEVAAAVSSLAVTQDGSRVVQRLLLRGVSDGADVSAVIDALLAQGDALGRLANDAFGNYVVQNALRAAGGAREKQRRLVALLLPCLPALSTSKAGSNVAEAVVEMLTTEQLDEARRLLSAEPTLQLGAHRFGKHVASALLKRERALAS